MKEYFDTAHFTDSLKKYPLQGGGCYLLRTVGVDYHSRYRQQMAKMPFVPDPRYSNTNDRQ
jgi:DNA polymerase-3 subunit alpha/error-prone DNA polymerase